MKIYVSSTFEDLKEFRRAVYDQLRKLRHDTVAMEDYVAGDKRPLAQCIQDVAEADVYVGIFAWRYGYIPKVDNPNGRSITELEYQAAGKSGAERLIFLLRDDAPWTPSQMDTHTLEDDEAKEIQRLREELRTRHSIAFFSTPDELAKEVSAAVQRVEVSRLNELRDPSATVQRTIPKISFSADSLSGEAGPAMSWKSYLKGLKVATSIGRIEVKATGEAVATGFLISGVSLHAHFGDDLYLVTPSHVLLQETTQKSYGVTLEDAVLHLTLFEDSGRYIDLAKQIWYSPVHELDVSIIQLGRQPEDVEGLSVADALPQMSGNGEIERVFGYEPRHLFIVGHPLGRGIHFSIDGCRLLDHDNVAIQYLADTKPGSGGSPVLDHSWQVIGIHRLRGVIPRLDGNGTVQACQAVSLLAIRESLQREFG